MNNPIQQLNKVTSRAVQFSEYALILEDSVEVESIFIKGGSDIGDVVPAKNIQCKAA